MTKHLDVSDETHAQLLKLQDKYPLSLNDLIAMGASVLETLKDTIGIESRFQKVTVNLKHVNIPDEVLRRILESGSDIFVPNLTPRKAAYLRRNLETRLGVPVVALGSNFGRDVGYVFLLENLGKKLGVKPGLVGVGPGGVKQAV